MFGLGHNFLGDSMTDKLFIGHSYYGRGSSSHPFHADVTEKEQTGINYLSVIHWLRPCAHCASVTTHIMKKWKIKWSQPEIIPFVVKVPMDKLPQEQWETVLHNIFLTGIANKTLLKKSVPYFSVIDKPFCRHEKGNLRRMPEGYIVPPFSFDISNSFVVSKIRVKYKRYALNRRTCLFDRIR